MHVVVPPWYHSRGTDGLLKALAEEREQVKKDMLTTEGWENFSQVMGWENIYVSSVASEKNLWCEGKSAVALGEASASRRGRGAGSADRGKPCRGPAWARHV